MRDDHTSAAKPPIGPPAPRRSVAVLTILLGVAAMWAVVRVSVVSAEGQRTDTAAMDAVYARGDVVSEILSYLGYVSIGTATLALVVLVGISLAAGRWRVGLGVVCFVAGANLTTQLLKILIDRPHYVDHLENSLPSGHTTLVMSLVLAALVAVPRALRYPAVLIATFLGTATGASTVVAGWHRPSDILAALVVCLVWGAIVALVIGWSLEYGPLVTAVWALLGAFAAGVLLIFVGVRPQGGWSGFVDAALVLSSMGLATALAVTLFTRLIAPARP